MADRYEEDPENLSGNDRVPFGEVEKALLLRFHSQKKSLLPALAAHGPEG